MEPSAHWDKLMRLIDLARSDSKVASTLREGSPSQVLELLRSKGIDFTLEDLEMLYRDLEYISPPRAARAFWSW